MKLGIIAVVDDDGSVREATKNLLQLFGYVATSFASAEDFLNSDLAGDAACLIADVQMPGMSGVELQARLMSDGNHVPIIFVTGFPEEATRARVLKGGAVAYLAKPLREQSLLDSIDRALTHPWSDAMA